MRANPLMLGTLAGAVAVAMALTDLVWKPVFTLQLTSSFAVPLWLLIGLYAGLQFLVWRSTTHSIQLSDKEVAKWGPKLETATPRIMERIGKRHSVKLIAADLERDQGIPKDVTLRYIIAIGSSAGATNDA